MTTTKCGNLTTENSIAGAAITAGGISFNIFGLFNGIGAGAPHLGGLGLIAVGGAAT